MQPQPKRVIFTTQPRLSVEKFARTDLAEGKPTHVATLTGYAMIWGAVSGDRGGYKVRLLPGSAKAVNPTHALYHHEYTHVLGSTANGTLRLYPDDIGVRVEIDLPDTTSGRDVAELVGGRYVEGMSFAMIDAPEAVEVEENGETILNVSAFTFDEVTITPIPAFVETSIAVKPAEPEPVEASAKPEPEPERNGSYSAALDRAKLQLYRLALESI